MPETRGGACINDYPRTLRDHERCRRTTCIETGHQADFDAEIPIPVGHPVDPGRTYNARIVHQDVDAAETLDCLLDGCLGALASADVRALPDSFAARIA